MSLSPEWEWTTNHRTAGTDVFSLAENVEVDELYTDRERVEHTDTTMGVISLLDRLAN